MSPTRQLPPLPPYFQALMRGFFLRCPRCGQGKMSAGLIKPLPYCTHCGQVFKLKEGEFTGGAYIGYGISVVILGILFAILVLGCNMDMEQTLWFLIPGAILLPLVLHRHAVGAFTAILIATGAMEQAQPLE